MKDKWIDRGLIFLVVVILALQIVNFAGIRYLLAQYEDVPKPMQKTFMMYRETPAHHTKTL